MMGRFSLATGKANVVVLRAAVMFSLAENHHLSGWEQVVRKMGEYGFQVIPALHRAAASAGSSSAIIMMVAFPEIDEHDNPGAIRPWCYDINCPQIAQAP